ncbi:MAG: DUF4148 domain-containing protein [Armatimonadetes bacterium]|nr:DUF4148 domain-containing protein [Armatimonadota bacterium]
MKRTLLLTAALIICACIPASANYLLLAPTGTTLTTAQVRAEAALSPSGDNGQYYWLATGLMQVELNVLRFQPTEGDVQNRLGAQWNFLPETMITPAVGFGVTDVTNDSSNGSGFYVAVTKRLPMSRLPLIVKDLSITVGIGAGGIKGPFGSVEAHFPAGLFMQAEYDSHDFNGAVGWQPVSMFRVKAYTLHDETYYGAEFLPIQF